MKINCSTLKIPPLFLDHLLLLFYFWRFTAVPPSCRSCLWSSFLLHFVLCVIARFVFQNTVPWLRAWALSQPAWLLIPALLPPVCATVSKLPELPGPQLLVCKHHTNRLTSEGCCKVSASWDTGNMFLAHVRVLVVVVIIIKSSLPIMSRKMLYQGILSKSSSLFTSALLVSSLIKIVKYFKGKEKRTQPPVCQLLFWASHLVLAVILSGGVNMTPVVQMRNLKPGSFVPRLSLTTWSAPGLTRSPLSQGWSVRAAGDSSPPSPSLTCEQKPPPSSPRELHTECLLALC